MFRTLRTGRILRKRYKIINILGSGGFGDTYLAEDRDFPNHPKCVVKHLKPNCKPAGLKIARRLFNSEAEVLSRLGNDSDQIPRLFAHFEEQGEFYLVQEFVDGEDLSYEIISGEKLTAQAVIKLLQEILEVLAVVHKEGIIHRDIKPPNLMRRRQDRKIVLIDFGAVKEINTMMVNSQGETSFSVVVGTDGYMPSEQSTGQPKLSSDVYAVGMLGIYALTGIQPHLLEKDPTDGEVIWRNWANVSDELAGVLNKMVSYHFVNRYSSAESALQALQLLQPQQQQATPPPTKATTPPLSQQRQVTLPPSKTIPTIQAPPPTKIIDPNWSRRKVIQTVGFTGVGLGLAIVLPRLSQSDSEEISTTDITTTPAPRISPSTPSPASSNPRQVMKTAGWLAGGFGLAFVGNRLLFRSNSGDITNSTSMTSETFSPVAQTPVSTSPPASNRLESFTFKTVTVNAQGKITDRRNLQAKYFAENLPNGVSLEMVQIPGGTFTMGSPVGEAERYNDESPQHQVRVPGFFMGKYPVTQAQYQAIMGTNPARFKGEKRPVEKVSWDDAVEFCKNLSQKTGRTYRLPSEAEWEYACRARTTTPFYFGETITTDLVNYDGNAPYASAPKGEYRQQTTDVGIFPPNSFGLYDMHGNIWEWCQDIYKENYQGAPTDGSAYESGDNNDSRLLRGGSWIFRARVCRSAGRARDAPANRGGVVGFRVVAVA